MHTPSLEWIPILFTASYFFSIVPHWFAEMYVKEFAAREYHLVLEVIILMVRNIVEGLKFTCIIMDYLSLLWNAAKANTK